MRFTPAVTGVIESPLVRIATLAESMAGSIKLCYGESDMPTPEFISRAAYDAARAGHTFYTNPAGYAELREAIARKVAELHGVSYRASEILCTVGASMGIYAVIRALVGAGDNAIIIEPAYAIFTNAIALSGGEPRAVPLVRDGAAFTLDVDRVRARSTPGRGSSSSTARRIRRGGCVPRRAARALRPRPRTRPRDPRRRGLRSPRRSTPRSRAASPRVADDRERIVVVNSFSKTYNMTGWRLGWVQASERMVSRCRAPSSS